MTQAFWKKVWTISLSYMRVLVSYCVGVRLDSQCGLIFVRSGCNIAFVDRRLANYTPLVSTSVFVRLDLDDSLRICSEV